VANLTNLLLKLSAFSNEFDFDTSAHGQLRYAKGTAGMDTLVAKHLTE